MTLNVDRVTIKLWKKYGNIGRYIEITRKKTQIIIIRERDTSRKVKYFLGNQ